LKGFQIRPEVGGVDEGGEEVQDVTRDALEKGGLDRVKGAGGGMM